LLPLLRRYLVGSAPDALATPIDLVPIVEDGLFGYELIPDRDLHVYPIIGRNAQGEPVLRRNSYAGAPNALHLVTLDGALNFKSRRAARSSIQRRDTVFPNWLAAAESAWAHLRTLCADLPRQSPILRENTHRWLDRSLAVAYSQLDVWDPFVEFLGLPNEAQLGFVLSGTDGEHGTLIFHQPDTWSLRWNAPGVAIHRSWSTDMRDVETAIERADGYRRMADRRAHSRRASDRGATRDSWTGQDRRQAGGRRALDKHAF
jgi:hypothetical protein